MGNLTDKLKGLYARAILRPEEEKDTGRMNEARNAAFLLIKLARENGVRIHFEVISRQESTSARQEPHQEAAPKAQESRPQEASRSGPKRYERPKPASPPARKKSTKGDYDFDAAGWKMCSCGQPIATRTWYSPYVGCTHVDHDSP